MKERVFGIVKIFSNSMPVAFVFSCIPILGILLFTLVAESIGVHSSQNRTTLLYIIFFAGFLTVPAILTIGFLKETRKLKNSKQRFSRKVCAIAEIKNAKSSRQFRIVLSGVGFPINFRADSDKTLEVNFLRADYSKIDSRFSNRIEPSRTLRIVIEENEVKIEVFPKSLLVPTATCSSTIFLVQFLLEKFSSESLITTSYDL